MQMEMMKAMSANTVNNKKISVNDDYIIESEQVQVDQSTTNQSQQYQEY